MLEKGEFDTFTPVEMSLGNLKFVAYKQAPITPKKWRKNFTVGICWQQQETSYL